MAQRMAMIAQLRFGNVGLAGSNDVGAFEWLIEDACGVHAPNRLNIQGTPVV